MSTQEKISELKIKAYIEGISVEQLKDMLKQLLLCQNACMIHVAGLHFTPQELKSVWESI